MEADDKKTIENILRGEDDDFEFLVKKYLKQIYNFLFQLTGNRSALDDLTQETFIKAWKNLGKYNSEKSFKTWLFTIAKNTAYDYLKKKKAIPFSNFSDEEGKNQLEEISDEKILPDEIMERKDFTEKFEEKIKKIPKHYGLILFMHYRDDFSLQEIAEIIGKPYNTIKSQHNRALKLLKEKFLEIPKV
jgi:RNA polymerase sigma-70 factor (ECF subfamily)